VGHNPPVSIRRDRVVADGLHEDLIVENHGADRRSVTLELEVAADLSDLFEVKQNRPKARPPPDRPGRPAAHPALPSGAASVGRRS
jgi:hypothetical protein